MHRYSTLTFLFLALGGLFSSGCASSPRSRYVEFALSTPHHIEDWQRLRAALEAAGIRCTEGDSSLGTLSLHIRSEEFGRARQIVESFVDAHALTVRITKDVDGRFHEVYQDGKRIREESYLAK